MYDAFSTLLLFCGTLFFSSLALSYLPFTAPLAPDRMKMLTAFGAGLLVGTALIVIVPEGMHLYFEAEAEQAAALSRARATSPGGALVVDAAAAPRLLLQFEGSPDTVVREIVRGEAAIPGVRVVASETDRDEDVPSMPAPARGELTRGHDDEHDGGRERAQHDSGERAEPVPSKGRPTEASPADRQHGQGSASPAHDHGGSGPPRRSEPAGDSRTPDAKNDEQPHGHEHGHGHGHGHDDAGSGGGGGSHKSVGAALAAGFLFMLLVDRIGGGEGHGHGHGAAHPPTPLAARSSAGGAGGAGGVAHHLHHHAGQARNRAVEMTRPRNGTDEAPVLPTHMGHAAAAPVTIAPSPSGGMQGQAVLGLIIHSAVDGFALGASAFSDTSSMEMLVFLAILLHKAPSAFGLGSFLLNSRLPRKQSARRRRCRRALAPC